MIIYITGMDKLPPQLYRVRYGVLRPPSDGEEVRSHREKGVSE